MFRPNFGVNELKGRLGQVAVAILALVFWLLVAGVLPFVEHR